MAKIAKAILLDPVTETIDLAKLSLSNAEELVQAAFKEPFQLGSQIRLTFIVGAGKAARQKYDPALTKTLCTALEKIGYNQDPGACCVNSCQGKFKHQHDTGQNLMYLHVFPKFELVATSSVDAAAAKTTKKASPAEEIVACDFKKYGEILERRCDTWIQRKRCQVILEATDTKLQEIENQMCKGVPIADEDQEFYDKMDREGIQQKLKATINGMKALVKSQAIDRVSKEFLLGQIDQKIVAFESKLSESDAKPAQKEALQKRINTIKVCPRAKNKKELCCKLHKIGHFICPITDHRNDGWLLSQFHQLARLN